jgi:phosphoglycolate phosphatase
MPLVVFDLDGTLIDSRRDLADAANALIAERGGVPQPVETISGMVGEGAPLLVKRALAAAGLDPDEPAALPRFLELYDERLLVHTDLYPGTREALDEISRVATLAVLTNKPQRHSEGILQGLGIAPLFAWVIGGDTNHARKPDPAGLRHLISAAGVAAPDTVMVGDSGIDLRTARAAGTRLCLLRYGFGFRFAAGDIGSDDVVVDSPAELLPALRGLVPSSGRRR